MSSTRLIALFTSGGDPTARISSVASVAFVAAPIAAALFSSPGAATAEWSNEDGQFSMSGATAAAFATDDRSPSFQGAAQFAPVAVWVAETAAQVDSSGEFSPDMFYGYDIAGGSVVSVVAEALAATKVRSAASSSAAFKAEYNKDVRLRSGGLGKVKWRASPIKESSLSVPAIAGFVPLHAAVTDATLLSVCGASIGLHAAGVVGASLSTAPGASVGFYGESVIQGAAEAQGVAALFAASEYEIQPVKSRAVNTLVIFQPKNEVSIRVR